MTTKKLLLIASLGSVVLLAVVPDPAQAYVDPGILGVLYQAVYTFLFGTVAVWLLRPWRYLKRFFTHSRKDEEASSPSGDMSSADAPK